MSGQNIESEQNTNYECDNCEDTGFFGPNGPGKDGNSEYANCWCGANERKEDAREGRPIEALVSGTVKGYFVDEKEPAKGQIVLVDGFRREQFVDGLGDYNTRVAGECRYCGNGEFIKGQNVKVKVIKWAPMPIIQ